MMLAAESRIHRDDLVDEQTDAAVAKHADVAVDEQADVAVAEPADATVDEQADAAVDKQADAAVGNQANAAVDKQANAAEERRRRERGVRLDPDCRLDATLHPHQDRYQATINLHCRGEQSRNPRASIAIPRREGSSANMLGSESDLTIEYSASSEWSSSYDAGHAAEGEGAYWCSDGGDEAPLYWWISFKEKPVEIVTIMFEEKYPGAVFEFFGS